MTNFSLFSFVFRELNLSEKEKKKQQQQRKPNKKRRTKQDTKSNHRRAKMILIHYSIEHKPWLSGAFFFSSSNSLFSPNCWKFSMFSQRLSRALLGRLFLFRSLRLPNIEAHKKCKLIPRLEGVCWLARFCVVSVVVAAFFFFVFYISMLFES